MKVHNRCTKCDVSNPFADSKIRAATEITLLQVHGTFPIEDVM